jgi:hypothetical protein
MDNRPNTTDPLWIDDERSNAHKLALEVYGPLAKTLGYAVTVRPIAGAFGIFLVDAAASGR